MGNTCFKGRVGVANRSIYLLMVGLDNAGKTCTAKSIVGEPLENVAPTVGFSKAEHKYKGYHVTIYDLGGSKSFRGIWNKYYHEVHGFVFVVDSSDMQRVEECREVLREMLENNLVRGKPILLLCNKSDIEQAQDEVELVSRLDVEALVNAAQCPTRVEASNASRGQGLKDGYKWLVKSVIANYVDLEARVSQDTEAEKRREEQRRTEARRRIEERRRKEEEENPERRPSTGEEVEPPGFVPVEELRRRWDTQDGGVSMRVNVSAESLDSDGIQIESERIPRTGPVAQTNLNQLRVSDLPRNGSANGTVSHGTVGSNGSLAGGRRPSQNGAINGSINGGLNGKLELEPIHRPKKKSLLSKMKTEIKTIDGQVSGGGGYRNWGLAEDLSSVQ